MKLNHSLGTPYSYSSLIVRLALRLFDNEEAESMFNRLLGELLRNYSKDFPENNEFLIQEMRLLPEHIEFVRYEEE